MMDGCSRSCIMPDTVSGRPFVADASLRICPASLTYIVRKRSACRYI